MLTLKDGIEEGEELNDDENACFQVWKELKKDIKDGIPAPHHSEEYEQMHRYFDTIFDEMKQNQEYQKLENTVNNQEEIEEESRIAVYHLLANTLETKGITFPQNAQGKRKENQQSFLIANKALSADSKTWLKAGTLVLHHVMVLGQKEESDDKST